MSRLRSLKIYLKMSIFLICFVSFSFCPVAAFEYKDNTFHYKLQIPEGWVKMNQSALSNINKTASTADGTGPKFIMGFLKGKGSQTVYPTYMLMEHDVARISFQKLAERFAGKSVNLNQKMPSLIEELNKKMPNMVKESLLSEPIIDKERKIIIIPSTQHIDSVGSIKSLTVLCLGNPGLVTLYLYSLEREYPVDFPVFSSIIESFAFEAGYEATETKLFDSPSGTSVLIRYVLGAAFGVGIYWLIIYLIRRRRVA